MEELLKQLVTKENIAELNRTINSMKYQRLIMINDNTMPESVINYNKELLGIDNKISEIVIKIKDELKKGE